LNKTDLSGDGLHDCIDATLYYVSYYPDAQMVYNPNVGGVAHLFVYHKGQYIEPQTEEPMTKAWNDYNPRFNKVMTREDLIKRGWLNR
jgi:hypothetical protein